MMADPHFSFPVVHVAGTNGKGSTVRFVSAILAAHGLTVGSFVSPHLHFLEERYALNNDPISRDEFAELVSENAPIVELFEDRFGERLTYFELTAVLAFAWMADRAVDVGVVEVGLGGRLDATNVVVPAVSVITSIGMDHTEFLGDTLTAIAGEKAAIIKEEGTAVIGALPAEAQGVVGERVDAMTARLLRLGVEFRVDNAALAVGGWSFDVDGVFERYDDLLIASHGRHQVDNFAVAVAACEELTGKALSSEALLVAAGVLLPGRMEIVSGDPLTMLDGAHNPHGVAALAASLAEEFPSRRWHLIYGATGERDLTSIMSELAPVAASVLAVPVESPKARPVSDIVAAAQGAGIEAAAANSLGEALDLARSRAQGDDGVLVAGSIYLVGEARQELVPE